MESKIGTIKNIVEKSLSGAKDMYTKNFEYSFPFREDETIGYETDDMFAVLEINTKEATHLRFPDLQLLEAGLQKNKMWIYYIGYTEDDEPSFIIGIGMQYADLFALESN